MGIGDRLGRIERQLADRQALAADGGGARSRLAARLAALAARRGRPGADPSTVVAILARLAAVRAEVRRL